MKILISYLFCTKGGVETALYNRLKMLDNSKLQVDLHFFKDYGGMTLFKNYDGKVFIQENDKILQEVVRTNNYDTVISIDSTKIIKLLIDMEYNGKIGLEVHTTYEENLKYLEDKAIKNVNFVIVPSNYQKNLIKDRIKDRDIYVLGNAVNEHIIYHADKKLNGCLKIILWVGRLDKHKNWRLFLKVARELNRLDKKYIFWIIGGLKSESSEIDEFEHKIYEYGLECHVKWFPQLPYERMGEMYSYASNSGGGYISTSTNESFGMTIIEAMACKCPVIVNNAGAMPELVDGGRGLCLTEMGSQYGVKKIHEFLQNPNKIKIIEDAKKYVLENFSGSNIGKQFAKLLQCSDDKLN